MQSVPSRHRGLVEWSITVDPVVVNPDIDSNHEWMAPEKTSATATDSIDRSAGP